MIETSSLSIATPENATNPEAALEKIKPQEAALENSETALTFKLENAFQQLQKNQQHLETLTATITPDEDVAIAHALETKPENKKLAEVLREKYNALIHAQAHAKAELSEKYHPKLVQAVESKGKIIGAFLGAAGGHGFASAAGAVIGTKVGGYLFLKGFSTLADKLPVSLQEKIAKPKEVAETNPITTPEKTSEAGAETKQESTAERRERIHRTLQERMKEVENLSPEEKIIFSEAIEKNPDTVPVLNRVRDVYERYATFYEKLEHRHPTIFTVTEIGVHYAFHIVAIIETGIETVRIMNYLAHATGTDKLTQPMALFFSRTKDRLTQSINSLKEKAGRIQQSHAETIISNESTIP